MQKIIVENKYILHEDGSVYSLIHKKFLTQDTSNRSGYIRIALSLKDGRQKKLLHRLVAEYFIPKVVGKNFVNHVDGDKTNNHVSNLEWVSQSENEIHAYKTGLRPNAIRNCSYKNEVFSMVKDLADNLGISYNTAYNRCLSKYQPDYQLL